MNVQQAVSADDVLTRGRFTPKFAGLLVTGLLLAGTLGVGYVTGLFAAHSGESFNWETGALAATAFATAALAGFTGLLAYTTRSDVSATWELARQGKTEQERRDRPALVVTAFQFGSSTPTCEVCVRNAGVGPAVYITVNVEGRDGDQGLLLSASSTNAHFLGPGEEEKIAMDLQFERDPSDDLAELKVSGVSLDRLGRPNHFMWKRDQATGQTSIKLSDES